MSPNLSEEELTPHMFVARSGDNDVWCRDCEYHQDHAIHAAAATDTGAPQEGAEHEQRCGGTGMVAYWDGSAYAGEMCRGCIDCEGPDEE